MRRNGRGPRLFENRIPQPEKMTMSTSRSVLASLILISAFASLEPAAAFPSVGQEACEQAQALKTSYLRCESLAQNGALDGSGIAECSEIYETLKHRVFDGSYSALRAWYEGTEDALPHPRHELRC